MSAAKRVRKVRAKKRSAERAAQFVAALERAEARISVTDRLLNQLAYEIQREFLRRS